MHRSADPGPVGFLAWLVLACGVLDLADHGPHWALLAYPLSAAVLLYLSADPPDDQRGRRGRAP